VGRGARAGMAAAGLAIGLVGGYLAERAILRPRLLAEPQGGPPLGSIAGLPHVITGPDGAQLFVEVYGPADAPQLVLVHGWCNTGRVWHDQVLALSDRYRIITYDQPGHGRSSAPRSGEYDIGLCGDALAAVVTQIARPGPLVLAGHSLGGMTVMNALLWHPAVRERAAGVVLLATTSAARSERVTMEVGIELFARLERVVRRAAPWLRENRGSTASARAYTASTDLSYLLTRFIGTGPDADPRIVDFTEQQVLDSDPDMMLALIHPLLGLDVDDALACLTMPTTIVAGERDRLTPASLSRRMATQCPAAELVELEGGGHMVQLEAPAEVNAVLEKHLARLGPPVGTA
jgi:pimeloyl-ACP methyl ester carboxylesterase